MCKKADNMNRVLSLESLSIPDFPSRRVSWVLEAFLYAVASAQAIVGIFRIRAAHHPSPQVLGRDVAVTNQRRAGAKETREQKKE